MTDKRPPLTSKNFADEYPTRVAVAKSRLVGDWLVFRGHRLLGRRDTWSRAMQLANRQAKLWS